jgi:hypothetical protein
MDRVHGPAVHESMTFIKYESSAPKSVAQIDPSEPLSLIKSQPSGFGWMGKIRSERGGGTVRALGGVSQSLGLTYSRRFGVARSSKWRGE